MKRFICTALVLALLGAFPPSPAKAEASEVVSQAVEVVTTGETDSGDTDATFTRLEQAPAEAPEAPAAEAPALEAASVPEVEPVPYARVQPDGAALYAGAERAQALGIVAGGSVVLALGGEAMTKVALYAQGGVIVGYMDAGALAPLTEAERAAYLDTAASGEAVALYEDDLNRPLTPVAFTETAPAEETPVEAQPDPAPAEEPPVEVQPEAAPAEEASVEAQPEAAPAEEAPVEAQPDPAPAEETPVEVQPEAAPAEEAPVEVQPEAAPAEETPVEVQPEAVPAEEAPVEVQPEAAPAGENPVEVQPEADAAVLAPVEQTESIPEAPAASVPETQSAEALVVAAPAAGIRLSAENLTIGHKEVYTGLTAIAVPEGSTLPAVSWRSDNTKYVKVDAATGAITGVKKGSATVYATMAEGVEAACLVTVDRAPKKLAVTPAKLTLGSGGMTAQLTWSLPKGGTTHSVTYSSNKPSVATVDANGLITSVNPGTATVTVKAYNGKSAKCKIKVVPAPASVAFPLATLSVATGQKVSIGAKALASNGKALESAVTYVIDPGSADSGCVALDPTTGELTGVHKGQAIITATTYNGISASCPVVVAVGPAAIKLSEDAITLGVKENHPTLRVELTPPAGEAECASAVTWSVSNKKLVKVDDVTGAITGLKKGSCTITATTTNGLTASCSVTVVKAPSKLSLEPANGTLEVGQTGQYRVKYSKKAGGGVIFATSDPAIATIDDDGVVTAISPGTVAVAVQSYNGKKAIAKLVVTKAAVSLPTDDDADVDSTTDTYDESMTNAQKLEYVIYVAQTQKGKPYKYGGGYSKDPNPSGFDCSGLVYWSFLHIGVKVEASAYRQGYDDSLPKITKAAELKRGDIVCFNTNENDKDESDHTGIYLGNGKFIHASSSAKKVVESTLASGYYSRTFSWGRRVLP